MDGARRVTRRHAIAVTGVAGASYVAARSDMGSWLERAAGPDHTAAQATPQCVLTGARTEGPYFVDEKLNRSDIRVDTSDGSTVSGIPLTLRFVVVDNDAGCAAVQGAQVDVWHCNANGDYSDVAANNSGAGSAGSTAGKKYLRGYQLTDAGGAATFLTIFPGWYAGRAIHIHFKIRAFNGTAETFEFTSQLFFDEATNTAVNAGNGYKGNTGRPTNAGDGIYGNDGSSLQVALTGNTSSGYSGTFTVGLRGISGSAAIPATTDTAVAAAIGTTKFSRTKTGRRILALQLATDEPLTVTARLLRGGRVLARRQTSTLAVGTRTVRISIPRRIVAGTSRLKVTIADINGNRTAVSRMVRIPKRLGRS